jgi:GNAT superfamily N-acetyltransferase
MKAVTIRPAEPRDMPELIELGREFFRQSENIAFTTFDERSFATAMATFLNGVTAGSLLVAESEDRLIGMAACTLFPFYCNVQTLLAHKLFWFCEPDYRNEVGAVLLDELEADARRKGADVFMSAAIVERHDETVGRGYQHRGFEPSENTYTRKLSS